MDLRDRLVGLLRSSPPTADALTRVAELGLQDWYLGAGAVCATVWNDAHGFSSSHGIKDLDIVYFDASHGPAEEAAVEAAARRLLADTGVTVDVTNEARVHEWYESRFGVPLEPPYASSCDAISTWPTTASAVGVRHDGTVCAPFGLDELFALVVRPNRTVITRDVYETKATRWSGIWPRLTVLEWDEGVCIDR